MKFDFDYQCDKSWDEMTGGDRRRFCASCEKHVHHISGMTPKQARAFLERHDYEVCVDFFTDHDGNVDFREPERRLSAQMDGAKQLLASALAVVPLALAAAFADFDSADAGPAPLATIAPPLEPIDITGPAPVVSTPPPVVSNWTPPPPPAVVEPPSEPIAPIAQEEPEEVDTTAEETELPKVVMPPRPHLRGRIKRPPKEHWLDHK